MISSGHQHNLVLLVSFIIQIYLSVSINQPSSKVKTFLTPSNKILLRAPPNFETVVSVNTRCEVTCKNVITDPGVSLTQYMTLPVEQYVLMKLPAGATLHHDSSTNQFLLTVPTLKFFHVECLPKVYCQVQSQESESLVKQSAVTITSDKCILSGSDYVNRLNSRFQFNIVTRFTWVDSPSDCRIISNSDLVVYVDAPPPFNVLPNDVLEKTGNVVMQQV